MQVEYIVVLINFISDLEKKYGKTKYFAISCK